MLKSPFFLSDLVHLTNAGNFRPQNTERSAELEYEEEISEEILLLTQKLISRSVQTVSCQVIMQSCLTRALKRGTSAHTAAVAGEGEGDVAAVCPALPGMQL